MILQKIEENSWAYVDGYGVINEELSFSRRLMGVIPDKEKNIFIPVLCKYTGDVFETEDGAFLCNRIEDEIKIIKYLHDFDDSVIPSEINGYSVTSLDTAVFINSNNLKTVTIPGSIRFLSSSAFSSPALREINVAVNNLRYTSIDGVLYTKDKKNLIKYPQGRSACSYTIPSGVETLGAYSMTSSFNLESVSIPSTVTAICDSALGGCIKLEELIIPEGVEIIEEYAFAECISLKKVSLPASLEFLDSTAFNSCENITSLIYTGHYKI